ncbi:hypothetical protein BK658_17205 [Pseudomonas brassicacearum]|uniref:PPM-type phosphatase domain-containing protein n=2 Tax=Pseudomonas brassicacearum TaxID=930166 RepID=A0A423GNP6_9PSED|nr:hypothetical protein BK658_17205 [Pseudomonas brassicacearum]
MTLVPEIRKNRSLMNTPDGYWILSPDGSGISHIESISIPYEKNIKILLTSDGLYRLVDTYCVYSESDFFKEAFSQDGLNNLIKELREIESSDGGGVLFPRVKLQDDASGLCINVNSNNSVD